MPSFLVNNIQDNSLVYIANASQHSLNKCHCLLKVLPRLSSGTKDTDPRWVQC